MALGNEEMEGNKSNNRKLQDSSVNPVDRVPPSVALESAWKHFDHMLDLWSAK